MSNSLPSVPSSPAALIALNEQRELAEHPQAFAEAVAELQQELDPTPAQGLAAAIQLVGQLAHYHYETVEQAEDIGLSPYQVELWTDDYKALKKALKLLRSVTGD